MPLTEDTTFSWASVDAPEVEAALNMSGLQQYSQVPEGVRKLFEENERVHTVWVFLRDENSHNRGQCWQIGGRQ